MIFLIGVGIYAIIQGWYWVAAFVFLGLISLEE